LLLPGGASSGGTKGKTERKTWAIYSWVHLGEGVRVWGRGGASAALGAAVLEEESEPEEGDDRWGQGVSGERERGQRTVSGETPGGPWAGSWPGPDSVPRPFTFFCSFSFSFFYFSLFFCNFCKSASKSFKPKPNFLKNSTLHLRIVRN
jgi:hypothetical protein